MATFLKLPLFVLIILILLRRIAAAPLPVPAQVAQLLPSLSASDVEALESAVASQALLEDDSVAARLCEAGGLVCGLGPEIDTMAHTLSDWAWSDDEWETNDQRALNHAQSADPRAPYHFFLSEAMPASGSSWPAFLFNHELAITAGRFLPRRLARALLALPGPLFLLAFRIPGSADWAPAVSFTAHKCSHFTGDLAIENRTCASSIDDVSDFVAAQLGSTDGVDTVMSDEADVSDGDFVVEGPPKELSEHHVLCHRMGDAPFQILACHVVGHTRMFSLQLRSTSNASLLITNLVACHMETSTFIPDHIAFKLLHVTPGGPGICHWTIPGSFGYFKKTKT
ncbi:hypothetical protein L7F22_057173 [Adiantum nelumboides]|nr:hypothetical protein [Adiantum nelumboides]